jgi:hypothetical protein
MRSFLSAQGKAGAAGAGYRLFAASTVWASHAGDILGHYGKENTNTPLPAWDRRADFVRV